MTIHVIFVVIRSSVLSVVGVILHDWKGVFFCIPLSSARQKDYLLPLCEEEIVCVIAELVLKLQFRDLTLQLLGRFLEQGLLLFTEGKIQHFAYAGAVNHAWGTQEYIGYSIVVIEQSGDIQHSTFIMQNRDHDPVQGKGNCIGG
ncbi:hypothetical protein D3C75_967890 [compost metagenome]